jgi:GT2 family glycosyltransferase
MVSVIITTYNRRSFLRDAVLSVLKQDYEDKEVVVVDDGSTDESFKEIRDLPVRYYLKPNGGVSSARNAGIGVCRGGYLAFLDVDDTWAKGKLTAQIGAMVEKAASVSYTDEIWLRNGRRLNQRLIHRKYSGDIFEHCLPLCIISPSSVVIRRDVLGSVGLFDESLPVCEDYDMWLRISCRFPVLFIPRPLIVKRGGHADQLSKRYEGMDRFRIASLIHILKSGCLSLEQAVMARKELRRKCVIYEKGARKRGKAAEADYYLGLGDSIHVEDA